VIQLHVQEWLLSRQSTKVLIFAIAALISLTAVPNIKAEAIRSNPGFRATSHVRTDDSSVSAGQPLGFNLSFFGSQYSSVFVNNNGNVTFGTSLTAFSPLGLSRVTVPMIAPFWADVDTNNATSDVVRFGQDILNGRRAFGVTYANVGYFSSKADKLNSFQVVLIDRSDTGTGNFDIEFNYDAIRWEAGDIESPNDNGVGGVSASAGYSNGTQVAGSYFEIPGSLISGSFLDANANGLIRRTQNASGVLGRLVFAVRNGSVAPVLQLTTTVDTLSFSGLIGEAPARQSFQIQTGGAAVGWTGTASTQNGSGWLSISPANGTASAAAPSTMQVTVNYAALSGPGLYQGSIALRENVSGLSLVVGVVVSLTPAQSRLLISPTSLTFRASQGGASPPLQTLKIFNGGTGSQGWSIPPNLASFLATSALSGTAVSGGAPSVVNFNVNAISLPAGIYQILVPISAPGSGNPSQLAALTLHVVASSAPPQAVLSAYGLIFVATEGGAAPPSQSIQVSNAGGSSFTYSLQSSQISGTAAVTLSPSSGSTANGPSTVQLTANSAGRPAGFYHGTVTVTLSSGAPQQVDVLLVVVPAGALLLRDIPAAAACGPQSMDFVATSVGSGVNSPVGFPQALIATVADNCGNSVNNATVVANADGQLIRLEAAGSGVYSANWTPGRAIGGIPLTFTANHGSFARVQKTLTVGAANAPGTSGVPAIANNGVVEGAGFTPLRPLAPGGIVSIFGSRLAASEAFATQLPLPRTLAGTSVRIGDENAPLFYVGPGQVNAQVPYSFQPGTSVPITVVTSGQIAAPQNYFIAPVQPGVFVGSPYAAVLDGQSRAINAENPARIGDTLQIFTTGLGATTPTAMAGQGAPSFSTVTNPVSVTVGGVPVSVVYQGLAPGFVGLYQVNVVLGASVPTGDSVPLEVLQNGIVSNASLPATIPVRGT
jgi:uncharacterized protein (TIGR03437 family)